MIASLLFALALQDRAFEEGKDGKGFLRYHESVPVLYLHGTPEEMGSRYGRLVKKSISKVYKEVGETYLAALGGESVRAKLLAEARAVEPMIAPHWPAEMKAAGRESGIGYDSYLLFNIMFDAGHGGRRIGQCSTVAVAGSASGEPMLSRNFDLPQQFWALSSCGLVVVRFPEKKLSFASVTHPVFIGTHAGVNEKGLAVGATAGTPGLGYDPAGVPCMMLFRKILEEASTAAEAEKILRASRIDVATTLMVLDAQGGNFLAELAPKKNAFRRPRNDVLYATNHFISPELAQNVPCERLAYLDKNVRDAKRVDEAFLRRTLIGTAPSTNLQSMIFFPARRAISLSTGTIPAAKGTFVMLDDRVLFKNP